MLEVGKADRRGDLAAAKQAIRRIRELELPFEPRIYELWFAYYSNQNATLSVAVDAVIANAATPTYEALIGLYEGHIARTNLIDRVADIRDGLQEQAIKAVATIATAHGATSAFHNQLVDSVDFR